SGAIPDDDTLSDDLALLVRYLGELYAAEPRRNDLLPRNWRQIDAGPRGGFVRYSRRLQRTQKVVTGYDCDQANGGDQSQLVAEWRAAGITKRYVIWDYATGDLTGFDAWPPAYAYSLTLDGRGWEELPRSVQDSIKGWDRSHEQVNLPFDPDRHSAGFAP